MEEDFLEAVRAMRKAQNSYFTTRKRGALIRSKQLEKKVDAMIDAHDKTK
ncbi:MAG: hypothetical protein AB3N16_07900 [Flavobacteriaceae bacterium]